MMYEEMAKLYNNFDNIKEREPSSIEELILAYFYKQRFDEITISNFMAESRYRHLVVKDKYDYWAKVIMYVCDEMNIDKESIFDISITNEYLKPKKISRRIDIEKIIKNNEKITNIIINNMIKAESVIVEKQKHNSMQSEYYIFT